MNGKAKVQISINQKKPLPLKRQKKETIQAAITKKYKTQSIQLSQAWLIRLNRWENALRVVHSQLLLRSKVNTLLKHISFLNFRNSLLWIAVELKIAANEARVSGHVYTHFTFLIKLVSIFIFIFIDYDFLIQDKINGLPSEETYPYLEKV